MKNEKPIVIIVNGDKNKLSVGEESNFSKKVVIAIVIIIAVLTVSFCCPEKVADFLKMVISILE